MLRYSFLISVIFLNLSILIQTWGGPALYAADKPKVEQKFTNSERKSGDYRAFPEITALRKGLTRPSDCVRILKALPIAYKGEEPLKRRWRDDGSDYKERIPVLSEKKTLDLCIHQTMSLRPIDQTQRTVLHIRTILGDFEGVREELKNSPTSVNTPDLAGNVALHYANLLSHENISTELKNAGAREDIENKVGASPRDYQALAERRVKIPENVLIYHPETNEVKPVPHEEACKRLGFLVVNSSVICPSFLTLRAILFPKFNAPSPILDILGQKSLPRLFAAQDKYGWGVYALDPIKAGRCIGTFEGTVQLQKFRKKDQYTVDLPDTRYCLYTRDIGSLLTRINSPSTVAGENIEVVIVYNCGFVTIGLKTKRDIKPGEEILWYYATPRWVERHIQGPLIKFEDFAPIKFTKDKSL